MRLLRRMWSVSSVTGHDRLRDPVAHVVAAGDLPMTTALVFAKVEAGSTAGKILIAAMVVAFLLGCWYAGKRGAEQGRAFWHHWDREDHE
jgi:hypothetical protein